jgi:hypothetical protein
LHSRRSVQSAHPEQCGTTIEPKRMGSSVNSTTYNPRALFFVDALLQMQTTSPVADSGLYHLGRASQYSSLESNLHSMEHPR